MAPRLRRAALLVLVVLTVLALPTSASAAVGDITEVTVPTALADPESGEIGPDGNFWVAEFNANKIAQITPAGVITEFATAASTNPVQTAVGSDGNIWFTENGTSRIGRMTTSGTGFVDFPTITTAAGPEGITEGPDNAIWFTEANVTRIGTITTAGAVTEFPVLTPGSGPNAITTGADGNLWVAEINGNQIARVTTAGTATEFPIPTPASAPLQTIKGNDGNVWFTERDGNKIGRITPTGAITEFPVPTAGSQPAELIPDADGNIWFTEGNANKIGRLGADGQMDEFVVPTAGSFPEGIRVGSDGNIWFTEANGNKIGKLIRVDVPIATTGAAGPVGQTDAAVTGTFNPQGAATTFHFEYGATTAYGASTPDNSNPSTGVRAVSASGTLSGLTAGTTYHYRLVATNAKGTTTGADQTFTTAAASATPATTPTPTPTSPTVPPPVFAKSVDVTPISGSVLVEVPGTKTFVKLTQPSQIQVGSIIDARHGRVRITIVDRNGKLWSSDFYEGVFQITQLAKDKGVANLKLVFGNFKACPKVGAAGANAAARKLKPTTSVRHLWGSGQGPFRTTGRFASATIRGTTWDTDDRCDGTLVKVSAGAVLVRDFTKTRHNTVVVKARHQYLARAGR